MQLSLPHFPKKFYVFPLIFIILLILVFLSIQPENRQKPVARQIAAVYDAAVDNAVLPVAHIITGRSLSPNYQPTVTPVLKDGAFGKEIPENQFLRYASAALNWTAKQKQSDGKYLLGLICNAGKCEASPEDTRVGLYVAWGRLKYFEKTSDGASLTVLSGDLINYADPKSVNTIQVTAGNCSYMYDLYKSTKVYSDVKNNAAAVCKRSYYNPEDLTEIDSNLALAPTTLNLSYLTALQPVNIALKTVPERFTEYTSNASDFASRTAWFNNPDDLKKAKLYLLKAMSLYTRNPDQFKKFTSRLGLAINDIYQAENTPAYMETVIKLEDTVKNNTCTEITDCIYDALFYRSLFRLTNNSLYRQRQKDILEKIINTGYDNSYFSGYRQANESFHSFGRENYNFLTGENALLAGLLSDF